ncbi:CST complex subunit CTC1-like protein, partial [Lates japonicus]
MSHTEEEEPERDVVQSGGTVTEVVSEGAGLYVIDGQVGLCLAYQPSLRRKLRAGDRIQLHHDHFLYRPCPDFPPSMLCTCLRSSLRVTCFSRVGGGAGGGSTCPRRRSVTTVTAGEKHGRGRVPADVSPELAALAQSGYQATSLSPALSALSSSAASWVESSLITGPDSITGPSTDSTPTRTGDSL